MSSQGPRIVQNTVTAGTGPFQLLDPGPKSFQRFRDVFSHGDRTTVLILDQNTGAWEEVVAQLTVSSPDTLTVLAVISSSTGTSISFAAGSKIVMQSLPSFAAQSAERFKLPVRCALTTNMTLASVIAGATVDGITLAAGDRVALLGQTTATERGIYVVGTGRAKDFSTGDSVAGAVVPVRLGTLNGGSTFICTNESGSDIVGTSTLAFVGGNVSPLVQTASAAAAGSTQSDAPQLVDGVSFVTGADGTKGVKVPVGVARRQITIHNVGASALKVYPSTGNTINGGAANAALSFAANTSAILTTHDGTNWFSCPRIPS